MKSKLSQKQIAEQAQLSPSLISTYESGDRTPNLENILIFADLYNCSVDYLLGRQKDIFISKEHQNILNYEQSKTLMHFINLIKQN